MKKIDDNFQTSLIEETKLAKQVGKKSSKSLFQVNQN